MLQKCLKHYHSLEAKQDVQIQRKHFSNKSRTKMSDPQPAPPTAARTNRWPRHYHPILAISSYKQISESHKISFRVYGLVKAKQTITSWHIIHFSSTPREQEKNSVLPLWVAMWHSFVAHTHTHTKRCMCAWCVRVCVCWTSSISRHP